MTSTFSQPVVCPVLIGREEALSGLRLLQQQSAERGRVALISGEAGIGKSRLVSEFLAGTAALAWRTLLIRFLEQDENLAYSGVERLLGDLAAHPDADRLIAPLAHELGLVSPEIANLATEQATSHAGQEHDDDGDKRRFLQSLTKLVRSLCEDRFTVLAFEDVHWADDASLEALLQIARDAIPGCLLVLTYRSDEQSPALDAMLSKLDRERQSAEIRLTRLRLTHVDQMLRACLGSGRSTRADVLHAIHQLTGGNPFFVEEVTRSILDQAGGIEGLDSLRLADFDLPRGVNEAVRQRTRALSPAAREVLSLAAVAGVHFDFALLRELSGRGEEELLILIKELIAAQLVVEDTDDEFVFRHALTREAIRSEPLRRERRALSRKIGEAIERIHAGDAESHLQDLSWHFYEAEEWDKALRYSMRAGERAMALYAPAAALAHLTRAIDSAQRLGRTELAEAFRLRGSANEAVGEFEAARQDFERAAAERAGDARTRWRALLDLGLLWAARDYATSEPYYRQALELARELGDATAIAHSLNRLGNWYSNGGDIDKARELSEEALTIFREAGDQAGAAQTLDLLGMTCTQGMRFGLASAYYREAIPLLEELDDRRTLASALASIQIGSSTCQSDMVAPALTLKEGSDFGERALALARQMGWRAAESYALWQLAFSLAPQGEYEKALSYGQEALAIAREIGHTQWETAAECSLGATFTDILATDEAQAHLRRAVELAHEMGSELWSHQAHALLIDAILAARDSAAAMKLHESVAIDDFGTFGPRQLYVSGAEAVLARGDVDKALKMLGRLEAESERSDTGKIALRLLRLRGRALTASGRLDSALQRLQEAEAAARQQGHLSHAWRIHCEIAHAFLLVGDRESAREAAKQAVDLIDMLAERIPADELRRNFQEGAMEHLPGTLRRRASSAPAQGLTARESEIAGLVAHGLTNREIAEKLVLSSRTVETHVANAMAKLGFTTRSQLAAWAIEQGLSAERT